MQNQKFIFGCPDYLCQLHQRAEIFKKVYHERSQNEKFTERTFFERSPRSTRSATSFRNPSVLANYSVTINLPSNARQPLKTVAIAQQANLETIVFDPDRTTAYLGEKKGDRTILY